MSSLLRSLRTPTTPSRTSSPSTSRSPQSRRKHSPSPPLRQLSTRRSKISIVESAFVSFEGSRSRSTTARFALSPTVPVRVQALTFEPQSQIIAFAGFSSYIGDEGFRQQGTPKAIIHLRDLTKLDPGSRPAIVVKGQTAGNQVFHTDSGFVVFVHLLEGSLNTILTSLG